MNKSKLLLALLPLTGLFFLFFTIPVNAQKVGESCCQGEYVFKEVVQQCVRRDYIVDSKKNCSKFARTACEGPEFLNYINLHTLNPDNPLVIACVDVVTNVCGAVHAINISDGANIVCKQIPPFTSSKTLYDACVKYYTDSAYKDNVISPQCDSGLSCNAAGLCCEGDNCTQTFELCKNISSNEFDPKRVECNKCLTSGGVDTAIGCIRFDPKAFVSDFLKIALGIAGGIAFLLMIYGAFLISTSAGDPKKADEGKEVITGTIAGLLFIIFSVMLLKVIGVDILQIPGF